MRAVSPYIKIKAKTGLSQHEWILGDCDETSLSNQRSWDKTKIDPVYFDNSRFHV
jgi:hypothetical protein